MRFIGFPFEIWICSGLALFEVITSKLTEHLLDENGSRVNSVIAHWSVVYMKTTF